MVFSKQGRYAEALASLSTATQCDRASALPHSSLAALYSALGERDHAATHYVIAAQLAPTRPNVLLNYAMFLHTHGSRYPPSCVFTDRISVRVMQSPPSVCSSVRPFVSILSSEPTDLDLELLQVSSS